MDIVEKIRNDMHSYGSSHAYLSQYVIANIETINTMTITQISKNTYCSSSTVFRFINRLGFESYYEFCLEIKRYNNDYESSFIFKSFELVDEYIKKNEEQIKIMVDKIVLKEKVYIFAFGQSFVPAVDFERKVNKMFRNKVISSYTLEDSLSIIDNISLKDLIIFISNSGESRELIVLSDKITSDYLITNRKKSTLANKCKNIINLNNNFENKKQFKDFPQESKYTMIYFLDCIFNFL